MATTLHREDPETVARLELRALERMVSALCEHTEQLSHDVRTHSERESRETDFQLQAFEERRTQALRVLKVHTREPDETRIARLEKLVEALNCSRSYFRPNEAGVEASQWAVLLR